MAEAPLRLRAEDAEDLGVLSAALQDSLFLVRDLSFDARGRRFIAAVNRFRWETAGGRGPYERVRSALSVETALAVKSRKLRLDANDATGSVLDLAFEPGNEPGGSIVLRLAGGGAIAIDVECIDVSLTDVGAPWRTSHRPDHEKA